MSRKITYISVAAAGIALSYGLLFLLGTSAVDAYIDEDGVVESIGALALLAASVFFFLAFLWSRALDAHVQVMDRTLCALLRERGRRGAPGGSVKQATTLPRPARANLFSFADLRTALRFRTLR